MHFVEALLNRLAQAIACVGLLGLMVIAAFVFVEGVSRWLFAYTFPGLLDVIRLTLPIVITATFPAALLRGQHIAIRFAGALLGHRVGRSLDLLGALLLLVVLAAIGHQLFVYANDAHAAGDATWTLQLPVAPSYYAAAALMTLAALAQVLVILRDYLGSGSDGGRGSAAVGESSHGG